MPNKNEKKLTLRQRLRAAAETNLDKILREMEHAAARVLDEAGTDIDEYDLMHLCAHKDQKSLRSKLVTQLANEAESGLERIYNTQLGLPGVDNG
jgi:hypothetical protein